MPMVKVKGDQCIYTLKINWDMNVLSRTIDYVQQWESKVLGKELPITAAVNVLNQLCSDCMCSVY